LGRCDKHGEFFQTASSINKGQGCFHCAADTKGKRCRSSTDNFIKKSKNIHNNFFNYSLVDYVKNSQEITIICPLHGKFKQRPGSHLRGNNGCKNCQIENKRRLYQKSKLEFIKEAEEVHGNLYNYSKVDYINVDTPVEIVCKTHGVFYQTPWRHIKQKNGCKLCNGSLMERLTAEWLQENKIKFTTQKCFKNCKNINQLRFDFYLPELNICIECQGEQHFKPIDFYGGEKAFQQLFKRDKIKKDFCKKENIKLLEILWTEKSIKNFLDLEFSRVEAL
jgi:hypothetical protein